MRGALGVIRPASDREPKELWTATATARRSRVVPAAGERDEAAWVVARVRERASRGGVSPSGNRGVLPGPRPVACSRRRCFARSTSPTRSSGARSSTSAPRSKTLIAYLRVLVNPKSDVDMFRIINVPPRGHRPAPRSTKTHQAADLLGVSLFRERSIRSWRGRCRRRRCPGGQLPPLARRQRRSLLGFRDQILGLMTEAKSRVAEHGRARWRRRCSRDRATPRRSSRRTAASRSRRRGSRTARARAVARRLRAGGDRRGRRGDAREATSSG